MTSLESARVKGNSVKAWRQFVVGVAFLAVAASSGCARQKSVSERRAETVRIALSKASPTDLVAVARKDAALATAFSVTGTSPDPSGTLRTVIRWQGDNASGELSTADSTVDVLRVDSLNYVRGPATFWAGTLKGAKAKRADSLSSTWVSFDDVTETFSSLNLLLNRQNYVNKFLVVSSAASKAPDARVRGIDCYVIKDVTATFMLAKDDGRPIEVHDGSGGVVSYDYAQSPLPVKPSDADVVPAFELGLG